ncbi:YihY/virulence factor BrkB family protein [Adhaeribacter soli]|uniref:YihY/virulence factor BrkB family protein n=1 Tax=Adhaeribacter soli TaxID=2607655 RepID=A0A5N1IUL5_9BACT|nr:YihY/virulence factor BrkB family protein [Adhaeribacter soli]KAA9333631.1 YihY/virulence factor BrkB family protein [Adhaeribacter soli]
MNLNWSAAKEIIKKTFSEFIDDNPLDHAAIIGFYTIFSLPAVLIIMIRIAGAFFGQEAVQGEVVAQIGGIIGQKSAEQIQDIIKNASQSPAGITGTLVGIATLAFTSTTVFVALQDAINAMWGVKAKPEKGWLKLIVNRVLSLAMVVSLGFLLLVSLIIEVMLGVLNNFVEQAFSDSAVYLLTAGNLLISVAISTLIFAAIFKTLPDARVPWSNVWIGAIATAILFVAGKSVLNIYLQYEPLGDTYGAAGSLVLILVWVYYASIIFLLGAEFTQVYSQVKGTGIQPSEHAVKVEVREVEKDK